MVSGRVGWKVEKEIWSGVREGGANEGKEVGDEEVGWGEDKIRSERTG